MKTHALLVIAVVTSGVVASGENLAEAKVPWSGTIEDITLKESLARITGWAEGAEGQTIVFGDPVGPLGDEVVEKLTIPNEPRPSYAEVLSAAYAACGASIVIKASDEGVEIFHLVTRRWILSFGIVAKLKMANRWSTNGVAAALEERAGTFDPATEITLIPRSQILIVKGTYTDLAEIDALLKD